MTDMIVVDYYVPTCDRVVAYEDCYPVQDCYWFFGTYLCETNYYCVTNYYCQTLAWDPFAGWVWITDSMPLVL
ncbi:hypothetical protein RLOatenuis_3870 [Rickettsiales bacterium]|nr:hypothetical protein RLOatenuis_3870 [Rickettsiales bacterium]